MAAADSARLAFENSVELWSYIPTMLHPYDSDRVRRVVLAALSVRAVLRQLGVQIIQGLEVLLQLPLAPGHGHLGA